MKNYCVLPVFVFILVHVHSGYTDTKKLIIKNFDMPYCIIVTNKNVSADKCTWSSQNLSGKPLRYRQQLLTIHETSSLEIPQDVSLEARTTPPLPTQNQTYLIRVNLAMCLTLTSKGLGIGRCTLKSSRLVIQEVVADKAMGEFPTPVYTIATRFGECIGFSGSNASLLTKTSCAVKPYSRLHNLWTFCSLSQKPEEQCTMSPFAKASPQPTTVPTKIMNVTETTATTKNAINSKKDNASVETSGQGRTAHNQLSTAVMILHTLVSILVLQIFRK